MKSFLKRHGLAVGVILALLSALVLGTNVNALKKGMLTDTIVINDPTYCMFAQDGRQYIVAEGATEILVLSDEGEYLFSIQGGKRSNGFYYAQSIVADEDGNLYVHDRLLNENGKDIDSERIVVFNHAGRFQEYLFEEPHDTDTQGENRNQLYALTYLDGALQMVRVETDSFTLYQIDLENGYLDAVQSYRYEDAFRVLMAFAVSPDGQVYFSDKYGSVWQASADSAHICLYDASQYGDENFYSMVTDIGCDAEGNVYFNDIGRREIGCLLADGSVKTIISRGEPMTEMPEDFNILPIYSAFSVAEDGTVSVAYSDSYYDSELNEQVYNYNLFIKNADGTVQFNGAEANKTLSVQARGWLCCAALVVLAVLAGVSIVRLITWLSRAKLSFSAMMQIAVIATALLTALPVSTVIINDTSTRYTDSMMSQMSIMATLMARDLRAEDIQSIESPQDYWSEAYQRIDASVKEILRDELTEDRGIYCIMYREYNDIVCTLYSDEGLNGVMSPMEGSYEGSAEEGIYNTGELVQISAYSSAEGHYMFTIAPVFDDAGDVIALIEVGTDLYAYNEANNALIRELLLKVLMFIITMILLFSESTVFFSALQRSRRERKRKLSQDVGIIRPIAFLVFFAGNMSTTFLPVYGKQLWTSAMGIQEEIAIALPLSAEVLFAALFSVLGGFIVDRVGTKRLIVIGSIILTGGLVMCGFVPTLWLLIAGNAILGVGEGLMLVSLNTFISNYGEEEQRNRGFSGYNAAYLSGMNCGTVIGSLIAEWLGYRPVFYIGGAILVAGIVMIIVCLRRQTTSGEHEEKEIAGMSTVRFMLSPRVLIFFIFMLMPYLICASFLSYFFPIYGEENGLSTSFVAQAFLLAGVISIYLGPVLTKVVSNRLGARWSLVLSTAMYVAGFTFFAIHPSIATCFIIIALLAVADSFGLSMQAVYFSALPEVQRYGAGKAMGINSAVENIAQTLGPIIFASLLLLGAERGILLMAQIVGVLLVVFVISCLLDRQKNRSGKEVKENVRL